MSGKDKKLINQSDAEACEARRKSVENVMAIMLSATNGPEEAFLEVLNSYIFGKSKLMRKIIRKKWGARYEQR